jgi:hypothetical protein
MSRIRISGQNQVHWFRLSWTSLFFEVDAWRTLGGGGHDRFHKCPYKFNTNTISVTHPGTWVSVLKYKKKLNSKAFLSKSVNIQYESLSHLFRYCIHSKGFWRWCITLKRYWVSGFCLLSGILNCRKHNVPLPKGLNRVGVFLPRSTFRNDMFSRI